MNLDQITLFRIAGLMCVGLIAANFVGAKRLGYAASLVQAETIVRQIFYVHCGYIVMIITGLAVLCLGWPELLLCGWDGAGGERFFWGLLGEPRSGSADLLR